MRDNTVLMSLGLGVKTIARMGNYSRKVYERFVRFKWQNKFVFKKMFVGNIYSFRDDFSTDAFPMPRGGTLIILCKLIVSAGLISNLKYAKTSLTSRRA